LPAQEETIEVGGAILTFISFTAAFLEAGENLSTYITWKSINLTGV
jgi:hypothetical protein